MMNKNKLIILSAFLAVSMIAGGCGKQEQEVISEAVEEVAPIEEESPEETTPPESPTTEVENEPEAIEAEEATEEESKPDLGYTVIPMEDTQMFATSVANIRKGPSTEYDTVGSLSYAQEITVNGKVDSDGSTWYVIKTDSIDDVQMVSGSLLSTTKPQQQQVQQQQEQQVQQQQVQEQPVQQEQPENTLPAEGRINPATGQPYKPGDIVAGGIWMGDASNAEDAFLAEHGL